MNGNHEIVETGKLLRVLRQVSLSSLSMTPECCPQGNDKSVILFMLLEKKHDRIRPLLDLLPKRFSLLGCICRRLELRHYNTQSNPETHLPQSETGMVPRIQSKTAAAQNCRLGTVLCVQWFFRLAVLVFAAIDTWFCRYYMGPDGVSYMDLGDYYWKGDWHNALSTYWSPLYSWMTTLIFHATHPSMRWEFPEVHLLNLAILMAALFCFEFLWRELLNSGSDLAATPGSAASAQCADEAYEGTGLRQGLPLCAL
ncbi:MAG: hypothetical protein ABR907_08405 [Terracidiphilus sp.]